MHISNKEDTVAKNIIWNCICTTPYKWHDIVNSQYWVISRSVNNVLGVGISGYDMFEHFNLYSVLKKTFQLSEQLYNISYTLLG